MKYLALQRTRGVLCTAIVAAMPAFANAADLVTQPPLAQPAPPASPVIATPEDALRYGTFYGYARLIQFHTVNAFFAGRNQDTASYGGVIGYKTAPYLGFSVGIDGGFQRGIAHSDNSAYVDGYLGPNVTVLGQAYAKWEHDQFTITAGNQNIDVPFISDYDYRMVPLLFQGVTAHYGDADNYISVYAADRYKSYIDSSFTRNTDYNTRIDPFSPAGHKQTDGFVGIGGSRKFDLDSVVLHGQAWYTDYVDYAHLGYIEGQVIKKDGPLKPFVGLQILGETGDGRQILGNVDSQIYGAQLGLKYNSVTATANYDRITPHGNSYANGSLVAPYSHFVASGPIFAQPFFSSTEDLGAGNAYSLDVSGSPLSNPFILLGARYSFMDLKPTAVSASIRQSEVLGYAIVNLSNYVHGLSFVDFIGFETRPGSKAFVQNRVAMEYKWAFSL